jgi:hypothetical protein
VKDMLEKTIEFAQEQVRTDFNKRQRDLMIKIGLGIAEVYYPPVLETANHAELEGLVDEIIEVLSQALQDQQKTLQFTEMMVKKKANDFTRKPINKNEGRGDDET